MDQLPEVIDFTCFAGKMYGDDVILSTRKNELTTFIRIRHIPYSILIAKLPTKTDDEWVGWL